jgi:quinol monooxygenase YgiN
MTAFNVVRFRVKPGKERAFIEAHERAELTVPGFRRGALVETGNGTFCMIGEWQDMDSLAAARPAMINILNTFRDLLEDLGNNLGVTDPVSGPVVLELTS